MGTGGSPYCPQAMTLSVPLFAGGVHTETMEWATPSSCGRSERATHTFLGTVLVFFRANTACRVHLTLKAAYAGVVAYLLLLFQNGWTHLDRTEFACVM